MPKTAKDNGTKKKLESIAKGLESIGEILQTTEERISETREKILEDIDYNPFRNEGTKAFTLAETAFLRGGELLDIEKKRLLDVTKEL